MPRDGSGTYSRTTGVYSGSTSWTQTRDAARKIRVDDHNAHDQDIASALTASLAKDGQTTPTANLPMGGFAHTNVADATARTQYAKVSQVQDSSYLNAGSSGGSSNAYTVTLSPAISAYAAGQKITFLANHTNTGASTLNVNSVGATAIVKGFSSTALAANDIQGGEPVTVMYDSGGGGRFRMLCDGNQDVATFTPVLGVNTGSASLTSTDAYVYKLSKDRWVKLFIKISYTVTSGSPTELRVSIPVTAFSINHGVFSGTISDGSKNIAGGILLDTTTLVMYKNASAVINSGTLFVEGSYLAA